jgi:hypothetical protein
MSKSNDLSFARLVDWIEGRLSEEEAAAVAQQVATADEATQADIAWLRAFAQVSSATVLATPPPEVREVLIRRFQAHTQGRQRPGFLQRFVAALTFDSRGQPAVAGLRTTSAQASVRQLIYTTDIADIALNIQPRLHDEHLDINGQIFPNRDTVSDTFSVQLLHDATEVGLTTSDNLGEFTFEAIQTGVYQLLLRTDQIEILIASVELKM